MTTETTMSAADFRDAMHVGRLLTIELIDSIHAARGPKFFEVEASTEKKISFRRVNPRSGCIYHLFDDDPERTYVEIAGGIEVRYEMGGMRYLFTH
jgi:hypothetical protein